MTLDRSSPVTIDPAELWERYLDEIRADRGEPSPQGAMAFAVDHLTNQPATPTGALPFQKRVVNWLMSCFSMEVCRDGIERNHRFLEEALELVQSLDCTRSEAHQLVDYVFDRPVGEPMQELGGTLLTLTALANCHDMDLEAAGETELARVWTKIDKIRAKQAAKPAHSPLPQYVDPAQSKPNRQVALGSDGEPVYFSKPAVPPASM